ncbi:protein FAR-RED IMPAIRED RESPONSE 1-like [Lycium ferocissimum]|uniref:protein FAR-RED IMPAIRED RESPONSE 1-like n=1 Tax=Lycium ferocissimum TaxID=112874 RepID=UPI0028158253|nr:protein FAR-RED IMPAIRED RESPONSE 1-like [Lycium ferocissimum]
MNQSTKVLSCSCKLFEFSGVLCRHALKILDTLNVKDKIPDHYIMKRWTKDVTNLVEMVIKAFTEGSDPKVEVSTRYRHLCKTFVEIASEASESKEGYELVAKYANEVISKLKEIKKRHESHENPSVPSEVLHDEPVFVDRANVTMVTGLKKKQSTRRSNSRPKSFLEKARKKNKIQSPPSQTVQHVDNLAGLQAPCPPFSDSTTTTVYRKNCILFLVRYYVKAYFSLYMIGVGRRRFLAMAFFRILSSIISWKSISTPKS